MIDSSDAQVAANRGCKVCHEPCGVEPVALGKIVGSRILLQELQDDGVGADAARIQSLRIDCLNRPRRVPESQYTSLQRIGRNDTGGRRRAYVPALFI